MSGRPSAERLLERPDGFLTTSDLRDLGLPRGAVESIFFRGVGPGGYDIYGVKFANGLAELRLLIGADGTVEDLTFRPDGDDTPGGIASCAEEASLKSAEDTAPIKLLVFNNSGAEVTLFSVDFAGHRTRYGSIGNEMTGSILTYVARPWIIADAAGKCLEIVWPGQRTRYFAVEASQQGEEAARATASSCSISERCRRFGTPYGRTLSLHSTKR